MLYPFDSLRARDGIECASKKIQTEAAPKIRTGVYGGAEENGGTMPKGKKNRYSAEFKAKEAMKGEETLA